MALAAPICARTRVRSRAYAWAAARWLLVVLAVLLVQSTPAFAGNAPAARWATDGTVNDIVSDEAGGAFIGGTFAHVGPATGGGVRLPDSGTGTPTDLQAQASVVGDVNAVVPDGSGGYFIGGLFTAVGGAARTNLAHILPNGTVDPDWNPGGVGANAVVYALAISGTDLFVGGNFTSIGGVAINRLAKVSTTGSGATDAAWTPGGTGPNLAVRALVVNGSYLYAGGEFNAVGVTARSFLAKIGTGGAGTLDPTWNPNANAQVYAVASSGTSIYAGGLFTWIGGAARNYVAKIDDSTGAADLAWNANADASVRALAVSGTTVYAGGQFINIGGQARNRIAKLGAGGTADASWNPGANNQVLALALSGTSLFAGGQFTTIGGESVGRMAKLDPAGTGAVDATWKPGGTGANDIVRGLATSGTAVYAAGDFLTLGGLARSNVAHILADGTVDATWNPGGTGANGAVNGLALAGSDLFLGGAFSVVGGQTRYRIAKVSATGSGTTDATWNAQYGGLDNTVNDISVSGTTVYAVGPFLNTYPTYVTRWRAAAFSTTGAGALTGWNPQPNSTGLAVYATPSAVYVGGTFWSLGGQNLYHFGKTDPTTGTGDAGFATGAVAYGTLWVNAIEVSGTDVYVGGNFTHMGGAVRTNIARINGTTGAVDAGWYPTGGANGAVNDIAVNGSSVYAGGAFTTIGGQSRSRVAKLGTASASVSSWWSSAGADNAVNAVTSSGSSVLAGGAMTSVGNHAASVAAFTGGTNPEIVAGPKVYVGPHQVTVTWRTDVSASSELRWDTDADSWADMPNDVSNTNTDLGTLHSRTISNLRAGTYYFRIRSTGEDGSVTSAAHKVVVTAPNATTPMGSVSVGGTGVVDDIVSDGTTVYFSGAFNSVGARNGSAVGVDSATGAVAPGSPQVTGLTREVAADGSGGFYVGGSITRVGGLPRVGLAHILPDGGVDPDFRFDLGGVGVLFSAVRSGSTLYIGGNFTSVGGVARTNLAAIDLTTNTVTSWNPSPDGAVRQIVVDGTTAYIGGFFANAGGAARARLAGIDTTTGTATSWNPGADGPVYALDLNGTTMYVGGAFTTMGGQARNNIGSVLVSSSTATTWNPNANATVYDITHSATVVYAGGDFTNIGAAARNYIAGLNMGANTATAWNPGANSSVYALVLDGTTLYVGGAFGVIGGQTRLHFGVLTTASNVATAVTAHATNSVVALAKSGSTVLAGGWFSAIGATLRNNVASISASTGALTSFDPNVTGGSTRVWAMVLSGSNLWLGGTFTMIGVTGRNNVGLVNATTGAVDATWNPNASSTVRDLALVGTTMYLGGQFGNLNGAANTSYLAAVPSTGTATPIGWVTSVNNSIFELEVSGGNLYGVGLFTAPRAYAGAWNATTRALQAFNPNLNNEVDGIEVNGSTVYLGGYFTTINGGTPRSRLAAVDATTGADLGWAPNPDNAVWSLEIVGSRLYVGGDFTSIGGSTRTKTAAFDTATNTLSAYDPVFNGAMMTATGVGGELYMGGVFSTVGSTATDLYMQRGIASFNVGGNLENTDGGLTFTQQPQRSTAPYQTTVWWQTSGSSSSELVWDRVSRSRWTDYENDESNTATNLGTVHSRTISNLTQGTYYYRVRSRDASGNQVTSSEYSFTVDAPSSATPLGSTVFNGVVNAMTTSDDDATLFVGGTFDRAGRRAGSAISVSTGSGVTRPGTPQVTGSTYAIVDDGQGGYFIGGDFIRVGGLTRTRLAHILPDGGVDPNWNPTADSTVFTLARSGGTLFAGGWFNDLNGTTRNYIGALDTTTGATTAWNPNANAQVRQMVVDGTTLYVAGGFTSIGGQSRLKMAALDTTVDTNMATAFSVSTNNGSVEAMVVSGGLVYVGGTFTNIGGSARSLLAALDASTGVLQPWNPTNAGSGVYSLALDGTTLYAGGSFSTLGGSARQRIGAVSTTTGLATTWNPGANAQVDELLLQGTNLLVAGQFTTIASVARGSVALLDTTVPAGTASSWTANVTGNVNALAASGSSLAIGGSFAGDQAVFRSKLAAIDAVTHHLTSWNPNISSLAGFVRSLAQRNGVVYIGGNFSQINGGTTRNRLAAVSASTGIATAWDPNVGAGAVNSIVIDPSGSTIYIAGGFSTVNGATPRNNIAALSATTAIATAWNPNPDATAGAMALDGTTLYVGGSFTNIGGQPRNRLAALDTTVDTNNATAWDPNVGNSVRAMALSGSTLYIGGDFTTVNGGTGRNYLAAFDTTSGSLASWNPGADGIVHKLSVLDGTVYAAGAFTTVAGQTRNRAVGIDASTGAVTAWHPNFGTNNSSEWGLLTSGSQVYIGGMFAGIGGSTLAHTGLFSFDVCDRTTYCSSDALRDYITLNLDSSTVNLGGVSPTGTSSTGTTTATVLTNAFSGYTLMAYDTSDTNGMSCGAGYCSGQSIADWTGTDATPTSWATADTGASYGFGVTVLTNGLTSKLAKWGSGTTATDFVNNKYAGLRASTSTTLHSTSKYATNVADATVLGWRVRVSNTQPAGTYSTTVTLTAVPNP